MKTLKLNINMLEIEQALNTISKFIDSIENLENSNSVIDMNSGKIYDTLEEIVFDNNNSMDLMLLSDLKKDLIGIIKLKSNVQKLSNFFSSIPITPKEEGKRQLMSLLSMRRCCKTEEQEESYNKRILNHYIHNGIRPSRNFKLLNRYVKRINKYF
jgi:hypothetical protein